METIQMTFSGWILKQTAVSILLGNEKERTIDIYIYIRKHFGLILRVLCWLKKANLKRL